VPIEHEAQEVAEEDDAKVPREHEVQNDAPAKEYEPEVHALQLVALEEPP